MEFADGQREAIRDVLRRRVDGFYDRGWSEVSGPNGDVCFVYCGTIREAGGEWLLGQLAEIALIPAPATDPEDAIRGLFLVHHEQTGMQEWQIRDGQVVVAALPKRYDYLQK
ncbi:hypothetical protein [Actinoplanes sp. N902-109]|uniref:hypothetical protein n=1 Tax=Actinoplanes sp. (strain N902-109) TaxID=649831 RepID=UPI000685C029|nr:hypothetical protein [Actinoplanes sp. N902-109]